MTAFWLALVFLASLAVAGWFVIDAMSCDPLYSDNGLARDRSCR